MEISYKKRARINFTSNSRGTNVETTLEIMDEDNEIAIREAKDLFERAKKAINLQ